jgi:hypothetical protein
MCLSMKISHQGVSGRWQSGRRLAAVRAWERRRLGQPVANNVPDLDGRHHNRRMACRHDTTGSARRIAFARKIGLRGPMNLRMAIMCMAGMGMAESDLGVCVSRASRHASARPGGRHGQGEQSRANDPPNMR